MDFEWYPAKSAANKIKHGISFEEVEEGISENFIEAIASRTYPGQLLILFRSATGVFYVAATERRQGRLRIITAHRDRKLERKYG